MDEVIKLVSQKAGINEQQARTAVITVADYLKGRLPPQYAAQVDAILKGGAPDLGSLGNLGGIFGKQ